MATDTQAVIAILDIAQQRLQLGDEMGHVAALEQELVLEPYCFPAMLMLGRYFERKGWSRHAALRYKEALKITPPDSELSTGMAQLARRARELVAADAHEYRKFLQARTENARARHPFARLDRFDHCLDALSGTSKVYNNNASLLLFPQLPAIPFFDNKDFPWLDELSSRTEVIGEELQRALSMRRPDFVPYVDARPGAPLNQWGDLNKSLDWSSLFFWKEGERRDPVCAEYPRTAAACEQAPLAYAPTYAPTVMYSCLAAGARIPPHTGATNTRLILHLPLIVPPSCGYRVGHITREWKVGEPWIFDDTIEHEAWNDSDQLRVVLILDIWNPLLSEAERELVIALLSAARAYLEP